MTSFLLSVAEIIRNEYSGNYQEICLVFPNQRAGLLFSGHLGKLEKSNLPLPKVFSVTGLFESISELHIADNLTLNFALFGEYLKKTQVPESFDHFYFWGDMLLNDFDEIDKYLVKADHLFKTISSVKEIEKHFDYLTSEQITSLQSFWKNLGSVVSSKFKKDFINIWDLLTDVYNNFVSSLKKDGIAYEGMLYRDVADKINKNEPINIPYKKIIFAGFNALTKCEEVLFSYLKSTGKAEFFWDYDNYYYNDIKHEAGFFIRKYNNMFPSRMKDSEFNNFSNDRNIDIYAVPSKVGQVKILKMILSGFKSEKDAGYDKTAIIFPDESLLIPSLYSVPEETGEINFTMGFPLKSTNAYNLVESLINLQSGLKFPENGKCKFYFKDVFSVLNHPYIRSAFGEDVTAMVGGLLKLNRLNISCDDLVTCNSLSKIFSVSNEISSISDYLFEILDLIKNKLELDKAAESHDIEIRFIGSCILIIMQLKEIINKQKIKITINSYFNLLKQLIQSKKIPFSGSPLKGLQLMGVLETRCLDFENVIILSLNEGIFPSISTDHSFIPHSIRKGFGLTTTEHQNSMYSYYFYRLIQRAKNIALIYNSDTSGSSANEMSRFIYQLKYESGLKITEKNIAYNLAGRTSKKISIDKDKNVYDLLSNFILKGGNKYLSPSSLITWLDCRLKFYFQYVIGLKEADTISEDIDYAVFGNILHDSMKILYDQFTGKKINSFELQQIKNDKQSIDNAIKKAFQSQNYNENEITGKNILVYEVIKKYLLQVLSIDQGIAPFQLVALESSFQKIIQVNSGGDLISVKIGGKIDRIDILEDNNLRIIDYKTGTIKNSFTDPDDIFSAENEKRSNVVFQTFFYSCILPDKIRSDHKIIPSVYWIRDSYSENFDYHIYHDKSAITDYGIFSEMFENRLIAMIEDIFNIDIPFVQCSNDRICKLCPFIEICYKS